MASHRGLVEVRHPLSKALAMALFLLAGTLGISCQDGPHGGNNPPAELSPTPTPRPIKEPSDSGGTKPTGKPARQIVDTVDKYDPAAAPCDRIYQAQVEVSKLGAACATYDMTELNNEAQRLLDAQLNKVQCPAGGPCTLRHAFYSFWDAACKGVVAKVRVKGYAMCATDTSNPNSTDPGIPAPTDRTKPTNKVTPAPVTMKAGENSNFNGIDDGDYITDEVSDTATAGTVLACHKGILIKFTYREKDDQLAVGPVDDYGPVISRAVTRATEMYAQYSCPGTCPKLPFVPLYFKWYTSGRYVVVEVYFMVTCP